MPWLVMAAILRSSPEAAAGALQALAPLLRVRRVLERLQVGPRITLLCAGSACDL
jgi:hypothetical protein